jgi:hypothetical protein
MTTSRILEGDRVMERERRNSAVHADVLDHELNSLQLASLADLQKFGWELTFVRKPLFQQPIPVVFDADRKHYVVLKPDGTLDENSALTIRPV